NNTPNMEDMNINNTSQQSNIINNNEPAKHVLDIITYDTDELIFRVYFTLELPNNTHIYYIDAQKSTTINNITQFPKYWIHTCEANTLLFILKKVRNQNSTTISAIKIPTS